MYAKCLTYKCLIFKMSVMSCFHRRHQCTEHASLKAQLNRQPPFDAFLVPFHCPLSVIIFVFYSCIHHIRTLGQAIS